MLMRASNRDELARFNDTPSGRPAARPVVFLVSERCLKCLQSVQAGLMTCVVLRVI